MADRRSFLGQAIAAVAGTAFSTPLLVNGANVLQGQVIDSRLGGGVGGGNLLVPEHAGEKLILTSDLPAKAMSVLHSRESHVEIVRVARSDKLLARGGMEEYQVTANIELLCVSEGIERIQEPGHKIRMYIEWVE